MVNAFLMAERRVVLSMHGKHKHLDKSRLDARSR